MPPPLLSRSLGFLHPRDFQQIESSERTRALHAAPYIRFDGTPKAAGAKRPPSEASEQQLPAAHPAGANSIAVDPFDGKYLLSGGADASISLWDLEQPPATPRSPHTLRPVGTAGKSAGAHTFGVTGLSFYPFDPYAFVSSSYDHTLRVWDTQTLQSAAKFSLPAPVYSHAISATATHLLVAAATKHPHVRLLDLRSGAATHALPGHDGAVLGVAWSPVREHSLASAGADGCVRLWDVRRAGSVLGTLDLDDSAGVTFAGTRRRDARAHVGPCNGVAFTPDGAHLVTCGHDERVRVWSADSGANTLVHFGPSLRNRVLATVRPVVVPVAETGAAAQVLLYPSGSEVLVLDLHEGTLIRRLRAVTGVAARAKGEKGLQQRAADVSWRVGHGEAYSAHTSGAIRAWVPRTEGDRRAEKEEEREDQEERRVKEEGSEEGERKRKRAELNDMFRNLTKQKITFT